MNAQWTEKDWADTIGHFSAPWPQGFAWRTLIRAIPSLRFKFNLSFFETLDPSTVLLILRYAYLAALRYETFYRSQFERFEDEPVAEAFRTVQKAVVEAAGKANIASYMPAAVELPDFLSQTGSEGSRAAMLAMKMLTDLLRVTLDEATLNAWYREVQNDWSWCHPLSSQEPDDLREFLSRSLWEEVDFQRSEGHETFARWTELARDLAVRSNVSGAVALVEIQIAHTTAKIDWQEMRAAVLTSHTTLDAPTREAIRSIANSPDQLAVFLSRMVIRDRTQCDLLSAPSLSGFQAALRAAKSDSPSSLASLKLELDRTGFHPDPFWLSWVQVVHRSALGTISQSLRGWLPPEPTDPDEAVGPQEKTDPSVKRGGRRKRNDGMGMMPPMRRKK